MADERLKYDDDKSILSMAKPGSKAGGEKSKLKSKKCMDFGTQQTNPKGLKIEFFFVNWVVCQYV